MLATVKTKLDEVLTPDLKKKVAAWWQGADASKPIMDRRASVEGRPSIGMRKTDVQIDLSHFTKINQMLWGDGCVNPGGRNFIEVWGQQLSLSKEKSTAFLGGGLGGQAEELHRSTGSWISSFEREQGFVDAATENAMMAGLSKRVMTEKYSPEDFNLEENKYHAIVAKEEFSTVENKMGALRVAAKALKKSGLLMFTDYVTKSGDLGPERLKAMFGEMRGTASLWTQKQYVEALGELDLDIHVNEELSAKYIEFITEAWAEYRELVSLIKRSDEEAAEKISLLKMIEVSAEQWMHVAKALDSGEIQLRRFLARKRADQYPTSI